MKRNCAVRRGGSLFLVLTYPLMMIRMEITGKGQELLQVRLFPMKMSTIINENIKAHPVRAWVMMS